MKSVMSVMLDFLRSVTFLLSSLDRCSFSSLSFTLSFSKLFVPYKNFYRDSVFCAILLMY